MVLTSPARVDAPTVIPALGGLLAAATVIDSADPHIGYGVEWFSFACGPAGIAPGMCEVADGVVVDPEKLFTGGQTVQAPPFAVYAGVVCDLFGRPYDAEVRARLAGGEERVVGKAFWQALFLGMGTGITPAQVGTTAVTKDTIVDVIAALEQYAGENYAGRPVLHMNKETATWAIAADVASPSLDGTLVTGQGTPIANSPGYPDGVVFLTGEVRIWRTGVDVHTVDAVGENQAYALAERIYAVGTDCLLAYAGEEIVPAPPFAVTTITPSETEAGDTTEFTITGTGFDGNTRVRVDGQYVPVTVVSPTQATFTWTAGQTPGAVDVRVSRGTDVVDTSIEVTAPEPTVAPTVTGTFIGTPCATIGSPALAIVRAGEQVQLAVGTGTEDMYPATVTNPDGTTWTATRTSYTRTWTVTQAAIDASNTNTSGHMLVGAQNTFATNAEILVFRSIQTPRIVSATPNGGGAAITVMFVGGTSGAGGTLLVEDSEGNQVTTGDAPFNPVSNTTLFSAANGLVPDQHDPYSFTYIPAPSWASCADPSAPVTALFGAQPQAVTAGAPGVFQPAANAWVPDDLAQLQAWNTPTTTEAWTTGQYVVLVDGSHAYWDGTTWVAGEAP